MIAFVVEDERDQRDLIAEELEAHGWRVEIAEDGIAAMGRVRQIRPDLILLDLKMPRFDGASFLKMLRAAPGGRAIRVVVVSAGDVPAEIRALADGVLSKPFTFTALREILRAFRGPRDSTPGAAG